MADMVVPVEDYDRILNLITVLDLSEKGEDFGFELTAEDERTLYRLWAETAERNRPKAVSAVMSEKDTLDFFGLSH